MATAVLLFLASLSCERAEVDPERLDPRVEALARLAILSPATPDLAPFFLDRFEVTCGEYRHFLASRSPLTSEDAARQPHLWLDQDEYPVRAVTALQAMNFARWRGMRLPTLAEWEWALGNRGGEREALPWGRIFDSSRLDYLKCNTAELGLGRPTAVGTFELGATRDSRGQRIYDLVGNVAEWVRLPTDHPVEGVDDRRVPGPPSRPGTLFFLNPPEELEDQIRAVFALSTADALHFHYLLDLAFRAAAGHLPEFPARLGQLLVPLHVEHWDELYSSSRLAMTDDAIRFSFALTGPEAAQFHHQVSLAEFVFAPRYPSSLRLMTNLLVPPVASRPGAQLQANLKGRQHEGVRAWWHEFDPEEAAYFHLGFGLAERALAFRFPVFLTGLADLLVPWSGWGEFFLRRYTLDSAQALDFRYQAWLAESVLLPWQPPVLGWLAAESVPLGLKDFEVLTRPWAWVGWSYASPMEWGKQPIPDRVSGRKGYHESCSTVGFRCAASPVDLLAWLASAHGPPLTGANGRAVAVFLEKYRMWFRAVLGLLPDPDTDPERWAWIQRRLS